MFLSYGLDLDLINLEDDSEDLLTISYNEQTQQIFFLKVRKKLMRIILMLMTLIVRNYRQVVDLEENLKVIFLTRKRDRQIIQKVK
jgi:hypothetical protein